jgi:hypothetical protein
MTGDTLMLAKAYRSILAATVIAIIGSDARAAQDAAPETGVFATIDDVGYLGLVATGLVKDDKYRYAQTLVLRSTAPEWVVYLKEPPVHDADRDAKECRIVFRSFTRNIRRVAADSELAAHENRMPPICAVLTDKMATRTAEVVLDRNNCAALEGLWRKALATTRPPPIADEVVIPAHWVDVRFATFEIGVGYRAARYRSIGGTARYEQLYQIALMLADIAKQPNVTAAQREQLRVKVAAVTGLFAE